jgi:RHS repeat-associated protein
MRSQLEASLELTDLWVRSGCRLTNFNRWYDATLGRWISEDPIGFAASDANLYRYVANSTTNLVDPNGLQQRAGKEKTAKERLIEKAEEHGVGDGVKKAIQTAEDGGSGYLKSLWDWLPGKDKNDKGMYGPCGESAEDIWETVEDEKIDDAEKVDCYLGTTSGGTHCFVKISITNPDGTHESYYLDNGYISGEHVSDNDDFKERFDKNR